MYAALPVGPQPFRVPFPSQLLTCCQGRVASQVLARSDADLSKVMVWLMIYMPRPAPSGKGAVAARLTVAKVTVRQEGFPEYAI